MPLVLRSEKGSQLTFNEMDGNFTYLEELSQTGSFTGSFIGDGSGLTGIPGVTPIATGSFATTGSNTFIGNQIVSGSVTISGSISQVGIGANNTFVGNNAGIARTTGTNNTLIGNRAGSSLNAGNNNTFIGRNAGNTTAGGTANTAVGMDSLFSNSGGLYNTAIGYNALSTAISSNYNVAIGDSAATVTGDSQIVNNPANSVFIGASTKPQGVSNTNTIVIGYGAIGNGDNTTTIGNSDTTATYLKGTLITSGSVAQQVTGSFLVTGSANINGFTVLPQVSASLNFANDTAAASGGVPLGGLYRNGNAIQIRLV
jgi:hypothetical protein